MFKRFNYFLILIAFLTGVIAPACGFSWNGKFSLVEICTTEGIEMKVIDNNSAPSGPSTPHQQASKDCQFCFQNNHVTAHITAIQMIESPIFTLTKNILNTHDILYRQILSQYHTARGPPSVV